MADFKLGEFYRKKTTISVPGVGDVDTGVSTGMKNKNGNDIIVSSQFATAMARLDHVMKLSVFSKDSFAFVVKSNSSSKEYTIVVEYSEDNKNITIHHKCPAIEKDPPVPCWHAGLALIFADILLVNGKARELLKEDWTKEDLILFLEQVYEDLSEKGIGINVEKEVKVGTLSPITITLRNLNQLLVFKKHTSNKLVRLGKFIDPLGGTVVKEVLYYLKKGIPFILIGDAGSGKTLLIEEAAKKLSREVFSTVVTSNMLADDIVGMWKINENRKLAWQPGVLALAMLKGGIAYLDELMKGRGALLAKVYSVLDHRRELYLGFSIVRDGKKVPARISAREGFTVVAAGNPGYRYGNVNDDKALFDRFVPIEVPYLPENFELQLLLEKGFDKAVAKKAVSLASKIRNLAEKEDFSPFSTRLVEQICRETEILGDFSFAVERMTALLPFEEKEVIRKTAMSV